MLCQFLFILFIFDDSKNANICFMMILKFMIFYDNDILVAFNIKKY